MAKTIQQHLAEALEARGSVKVGTFVRGGWKYSVPEREGTFYWLGTGGSLRIGKKRSASLAAQATKMRLMGVVNVGSDS